ncbi:MAG TPA: rod shape-determining protein MreD [Fredinandcohnia sp.]|nr:rod shape-determining protein MreD [Fredinandcohnia sp.]
MGPQVSLSSQHRHRPLPHVRRAILGSLPVGAEPREGRRAWRALLWALIALLLFQIQAGLKLHLQQPYLRIDVAALVLFFVALELGAIEGALSAFAVGFVADLFVLGPPGLCAFLAVALWTGAHLVPPRAFRSGWLGPAALAFAFSAAFQLGILLIETAILPAAQAPGPTAWAAVVPVAALTAVAAIPFRSLLKRLDRAISGETFVRDR